MKWAAFLGFLCHDLWQLVCVIYSITAANSSCAKAGGVSVPQPVHNRNVWNQTQEFRPNLLFVSLIWLHFHKRSLATFLRQKERKKKNLPCNLLTWTSWMAGSVTADWTTSSLTETQSRHQASPFFFPGWCLWLGRPIFVFKNRFSFFTWTFKSCLSPKSCCFVSRHTILEVLFFYFLKQFRNLLGLLSMPGKNLKLRSTQTGWCT